MEKDDPLANEVSIQAHLDHSGVTLSSKSRALAALDRLFGSLVDIPGSYFEGISRRRRASDEAREHLNKSVVQARIEGATELERLRQRAVIHEEARKIEQQINREEIAILALEDLKENPPKEDIQGDLDNDWINNLVKYSGDASSDRLKILFAKILSGEIKNPGSFSPTTLRAVSELTQPLAEEFSWAWDKSIGSGIWRGPGFESGKSWTQMTNLRDAGLLSPVDSAIHQPRFDPLTLPHQHYMVGKSLWQIGPHGDTFLWVAMNQQVHVRLPVVNFTRSGRELATLLPAPDYERNLRALAEGFPKNGVAWIRLLKAGQEEVLWSSA